VRLYGGVVVGVERCEYRLCLLPRQVRHLRERVLY